MRQEQRFLPCPRSRQRRLGTRMAATNDNHIKFRGKFHGARLRKEEMRRLDYKGICLTQTRRALLRPKFCSGNAK